MLESQKDMLLKGVCCLMLLQINGEAKGHTHISSAQKSLARLEKGSAVDLKILTVQKEALPSKNEIVVESDGKNSDGYVKFPVSPFKKQKKGTYTFAIPFVQRKMNMRSNGTGKKNARKTTVANCGKKSASSFQWKRILAQRGGKPVINRSVLNRSCMTHFHMENDG